MLVEGLKYSDKQAQGERGVPEGHANVINLPTAVANAKNARPADPHTLSA